MFGENTRREQFEIKSPNPGYLPIGVLMGSISRPDAMALAWMNDVAVMQMLGYTKPTWFGFWGWGVLDYYVEQPGRYTLRGVLRQQPRVDPSPARLHHAARHLRGLAFDRDVVAFYGDPKWSAKMAEGKLAYGQSHAQRRHPHLHHHAQAGRQKLCDRQQQRLPTRRTPHRRLPARPRERRANHQGRTTQPADHRRFHSRPPPQTTRWQKPAGGDFQS